MPRNPSPSLAQSLRSAAARFAAMRPKSRDKQPAYSPKWCRTRSCNQRYLHDGPCTGKPVGTVLTVHTKPNHQQRRTHRRSYQPSTVRRSPHAAPIPGVREHMAAIRAAAPGRRLDAPTPAQRRIMRAAAKAAK